MQFAVDYLTHHGNTQLVTIDIGLNDLAVLLANCGGDTACAIAGLPAVLGTYAANLTQIYTNIRTTAKYQGLIVAVAIYAPTNDPAQIAAIKTLNGILSSTTAAFSGKVADAFTAFQAAASFFGGDICATGLLIKLPNGTCDTHPTAIGQAIIAGLILNQVRLNGHP
jgi:lysophospholipase L1-like esterase